MIRIVLGLVVFALGIVIAIPVSIHGNGLAGIGCVFIGGMICYFIVSKGEV